MISHTIALSLMKILLLPAYHSTDFEVHRNWLAITHSLPLSKWYTDDTSEWTLDYPPLFAWFEWLLSKVAVYFDPEMVVLSNLNYASPMTVFFQRFSVILTDLVFAYAIKECFVDAKNLKKSEQKNYAALFLITFGNAGLLLVDHIHFQYNGFLFGIMFLSIARILQKREIEAAFWFCVLLNLKHIYLYIAPAYFIYLLRSYCFSSSADGSIQWLSLSFKRLLALGSVVISVFALSFGPFIAMGQLNQVLFRLFPFKRGLCHAFWAPNFWAFYNFVDKVSKLLGTRFGLLANMESGSMTSGLVQEYHHSVLPSINPQVTFVLTFLSMVPCLVNLWRTPHNPWQFIRAVTMCGFCSYLFGWHVHEKAVLMVILPLSLLVFKSKGEAKFFLFLSIVGTFSLFPLLFMGQETVIKVSALMLHASVTSSTLVQFWRSSKKNAFLSLLPFLKPLEGLYILGLIPVFLYEQIIHRLIGLDSKLPFLPLMIISVYCSVGVLYSWCGLYKSLFLCSWEAIEYQKVFSHKGFTKLKGVTLHEFSIKSKEKFFRKKREKLKEN